MTAPLFGLETGVRADLSVASGIVALPLAFASGWSFRSGIALTILGMILCLINFTVPGSIGSVANFATCCSALAIAGMAPTPVSTSLAVAAADEIPTAPTRIAPESLASTSLAA